MWIGHVKETSDFFRRFDITGAMVMESRRESGRITHYTSNTLGTVGEGPSLRQAQAHFRCDSTGVLCAHRFGAVGIGKNNER